MTANGNGKTNGHRRRVKATTKRPPNRPTTLSAKVTDNIVTNIRAVYFLSPAAEAAGVPASTARDWYGRGCEENAAEPFAAFARRVSRAQAETEVYLAGVVQKAAGREWQAAARLLEAIHERWARQERTTIDQNVRVTLDEDAVRALAKSVVEILIARGVEGPIISLVAQDLDARDWKQLAIPSLSATRPSGGERQ